MFKSKYRIKEGYLICEYYNTTVDMDGRICICNYLNECINNGIKNCHIRLDFDPIISEMLKNKKLALLNYHNENRDSMVIRDVARIVVRGMVDA